MSDNIIDFERQRDSHVQKRKEAKVDALRRAFRLARAGVSSDKPGGGKKRRKKSGKNPRK